MMAAAPMHLVSMMEQENLPNGADAENIPTPISGATQEEATSFIKSFEPNSGNIN